MEHETDYQRRRRQRTEVRKHGVTGSTPHEAMKRIKEHTNAKSNALKKKMGKYGNGTKGEIPFNKLPKDRKDMIKRARSKGGYGDFSK